MLPDHGYRPIAIGDLNKTKEWLSKDRDKKWDPALQEYVFRLELQPTENARSSSSSTEAASGDLHTVRGRGMCRDTCERSQTD